MLEIEGKLEISADGRVAFLYGHESHIQVNFDQPSSRLTGLNPFSRLKIANMFARYLHESGLTLTLSYRGQQCVVLGKGSKHRLSSRILGLRHMEIRVRWSTLRFILG